MLKPNKSETQFESVSDTPNDRYHDNGGDRAPEATQMRERGIQARLNIKPLSVNEAWQGKRFKTAKYRSYEKQAIFTLPKLMLPKPPYFIYYEFGMSNLMSDVDNPIKPLQDILQKKYGFNDKDIQQFTAKKVKVKKGDEYIYFKIESI